MGLFETDEDEGSFRRKVGRPRKSLSQQQDSNMGTKNLDENGNQIYTRICPGCKKVVSFTRKTKPAVCPFCHDKYWDKPRDEYVLFKAQEKWISGGRDPKGLGAMYPMLLSYSSTLVKSALRNRVVLSEEDIGDKASDMALTVISSYQKNACYEVTGSFGGLLTKIRLGVMFSDSVQNDDKTLSLDYELKENMNLMDNPSLFINDEKEKYEKDAYKEFEKSSYKDIPKDVCNLIFEEFRKMREGRDDRKDALLFLVGIRNVLGKSRINDMNDLYDMYGTKIKEDVDWMMSRIRESLEEMENLQER